MEHENECMRSLRHDSRFWGHKAVLIKLFASTCSEYATFYRRPSALWLVEPCPMCNKAVADPGDCSDGAANEEQLLTLGKSVRGTLASNQ